jgi:hypothetical protein
VKAGEIMTILPNKIKIGPYVYRVESVPEGIVEDSQELYGHVSFGQDVIQITTKFTNERVVTALLHEVLHALSELFDLGLRERQIACLAAGLMMVLTDNGFKLVVVDEGAGGDDGSQRND